MRPDISDEDLARLDEMAEDSLNNPHPDTPSFIAQSTGRQREFFKTLYMAGQWLLEQLLAAGASQEQAQEINFAFGQRCLGREPWTVAQEQVEKWKNGVADKPGMELAEALIAEQFAGTPIGDEAARRERRRKELHAKYTKFVE